MHVPDERDSRVGAIRLHTISRFGTRVQGGRVSDLERRNRGLAPLAELSDEPGGDEQEAAA